MLNNIDLNKLKELAKYVDFCGSTIGFSADELCEILNFAVSSTERLEAAERERDALKDLSVTNIILVISPGKDGMGVEVHANSVSQVVEHITRLDETLEKAEAELVRRDAAAGDPVAYLISDKSDRVEGRIGRPSLRGIIAYSEADINRHELCETRLYTAAQPVVLPPPLQLDPRNNAMRHSYVAGYDKCLADAKALGCQPEKVVMLPELEKWRSVDAVRAQGAYRVLMQKSLDDAGIKWEVQK